MVDIYSEKDIRQLNLSLDEVFKNVENCYLEDYAGNVEVPTKIGVHPEYKNSFMHAMPASITGDNRAVGLKWISYYPNNFSRGLVDSSGLIILNDPVTGEFSCIMEGMYITFLRTTASAAVAASKVVKGPKVLTLVGCGGLGKWSARFFAYAFPSLETVYVISKRAESRTAFIEKISQEITNVQFVGTSDFSNTIPESDIVVSAIPPNDFPPLKKGIFKKGSAFIPLDLTNSWDKSALDDFSTIYLDNQEGFASLLESKMGVFLSNNEKKIVEIKELVKNGVSTSSNSNNNETSLIAICGIASTDIYLSNYIYQKLKNNNLGKKFNFI